ncbi:PLDc N-terminal domain-containing protein [Agrobacterium sp. LR_9]|uniref:PLDc N-terminal domain-containing protein n=1 Tax=Agrobacterium sp. LR_9 TaxID=3055787 RepID=UPI0035C0BBC6
MKLSYELLLVSTEWIVRLGALVVIPQRRSPSSARAWLLLIFFLPIAGIILFLAIGNDHFPKWRRARFRSLQLFFEMATDSLKPFQAVLEARQQPVAELAAALRRFPATDGKRIELIDDYDGMIDRLVADIDA